MNRLPKTPEDWTRLIQEEEQKRERNWDPAERWRVIQETITWADQQFDPPRNSMAGCLRAQAEKLAFLAEVQRRRDAAEQE